MYFAVRHTDLLENLSVRGVFNQKVPLSFTISVLKLAARYNGGDAKSAHIYGIVSSTMVLQLNGRDQQACDGKISSKCYF